MSSAVPEGWELSPLSSLADYKNGRAFKPLDWSKSGLPILRIAQINNPLNVEDYYDGDDVEDGHFVTKGDLIFSWSATLKAVIWSHYDAVLNQHIFKVTEKVGTDRSYLQQLLDYAIPKLAESSHGSTMKHIKKGVLDEFFAPIPPLPEQKKIASILTSVDEVIENTQKQIDKLQDLKKATLNELLTKGIGHTEFKESEMGRIPKSWVVSKVSNHLQDMTSGWSPDCLTEPAINSQWGVLKTTAVTWDGFDVNENKALPRHLEGRSAISLKKGDVLVTRAGPIDRVGVVAFCSATYPRIMLSDKIIRIQSKSDELSGEFLSIWLSSHHAQRNIRAKMSGMAESQSNISQDILKSVPVPIPGISEQLKITAIIKALTQRICVANRYLQQTESLKKSLMQDLLTGTVRVTVN